MKLNHKTGEVTLSHAGPNGIYNHQKISYQFNKADLDLSRIDYVHVSGGNQDVPIRNLTINHEPMSVLHPLFDKAFKIDTSRLLGRRRASVDDNFHPSYDGSAPSNKKDGASDARKRRSASLQRAPLEEKPNIFKRLLNKIFSSSAKENPTALGQSSSYQAKSDSPRAESPMSNRPRANSLSQRSPLMLSKLRPCHDSVYCLKQNIKDHTEKYSHPCRFNELCRRQADEPHLIHDRHNVPKCSDDRDCRELTDPVHRAKYRHTNLPDYFFPCRYQDVCYDKKPEHRMRFFHGEELPSIKSKFFFKNYMIISTKSSIFYFYRT